MKDYNEKCNQAARKVAVNVLDWLVSQYPERQFEAYYHRAALNDGPVFLTSRIYQIGPGVRKIFNKRIADVGQFNIHTQDLLYSYDEKILPYEKLRDLMKEVNILETWLNELPPRPKRFFEKLEN